MNWRRLLFGESHAVKRHARLLGQHAELAELRDHHRRALERIDQKTQFWLYAEHMQALQDLDECLYLVNEKLAYEPEGW